MSTLSELTPEKRTGRHYHLSTLTSPEPTRQKIKDAPAASVSPGPATPAFAEPLDRGARESTLACPARLRGRLGWTRPVSGAGGAAWRPSLACPLAAARRLRRRFAEGEGGLVWPRGRRQELEQRRPGPAGRQSLVSLAACVRCSLGSAWRDATNASTPVEPVARRGRVVPCVGGRGHQSPADWTGRGGWAERRLCRRPSSDPYRTARRPAGAPFPFLVGPTRRGGHMRVTVTRQRC